MNEKEKAENEAIEIYKAECRAIYGRDTVSYKDFKLDFPTNNVPYVIDSIQDKRLFQMLMTESEDFKRAFTTDYTQEFFEVLLDRGRRRVITHLSMMGYMRAGKSYSSISVQAFYMAIYGKLITPAFIAPNQFRFLQAIKNMHLAVSANTMFLKDEDKEAVYGAGSLARRAKLQDVANITAKHNISTLSLCPTKMASEDNALYGLRALGQNTEHKVNRFMLYDLQEGRFQHRPIACVYIPIFTAFLPDWYAQPLEEIYSKMKDEWIAEEIAGRNDQIAEIRQIRARELSTNETYCSLKKKGEKFAFATQILGSEFPKTEVIEIMDLAEIFKRGITIA